MVLTYEEARILWAYDPDTGILSWRVNVNSRVRAGDPAGSVREGYVKLTYRRRKYRASRIIWLLMTCEWPPPGFEIDHRDRISTNDRWVNLRLATSAQNKANMRAPDTNTSGRKGVSFNREKGKWVVYLSHGGRREHLGFFTEFVDAIQARAEAEDKFQKEFAAS